MTGLWASWAQLERARVQIVAFINSVRLREMQIYAEAHVQIELRASWGDRERV